MNLRTTLAILLLVGSAAFGETPAPKPVHFATCTKAGVEHDCIVARGDDGVLYDVSGAVSGLGPHQWLQGSAFVSTRVSYCMQGSTITGFKRDSLQAAANCGVEH